MSHATSSAPVISVVVMRRTLRKTRSGAGKAGASLLGRLRRAYAANPLRRRQSRRLALGAAPSSLRRQPAPAPAKPAPRSWGGSVEPTPPTRSGAGKAGASLLGRLRRAYAANPLRRRQSRRLALGAAPSSLRRQPAPAPAKPAPRSWG